MNWVYNNMSTVCSKYVYTLYYLYLMYLSNNTTMSLNLASFSFCESRAITCSCRFSFSKSSYSSERKKMSWLFFVSFYCYNTEVCSTSKDTIMIWDAVNSLFFVFSFISFYFSFRQPFSHLVRKREPVIFSFYSSVFIILSFQLKTSF